MTETARTYLDRGRAYLEQGHASEALTSFRLGVLEAPRYAEIHGNIAKALLLLGETGPALAALSIAIEIEPNYAEALLLAAACHARSGNWEAAGANAERVLDLLPHDTAVRRQITYLFAEATVETACPPVERCLMRLYDLPLVDYQSLARTAAALLKSRNVLAAARKDIQSGLVDSDAVTGFIRDPLFIEYATKGCNVDIEIERFLIVLRRKLLEITDVPASPLLDAALLVALQANNNEYVWPIAMSEAVMLDVLRERRSGFGWDILRALMYEFPPEAGTSLLEAVSALPSSAHDLGKRLGDRMRDAVDERRIRDTFVRSDQAALSAGAREVRDMYEQNPYPRWLSTMPLEPLSVASYLRAQHPHFDPPARFNGPVRALIAGCGTGKQAIDFALRHPDCEITAIDLSVASLSYAQRMARRYGVTNVEFVHADLMNVSAFGEQFDIIECSGVLHHLPDPFPAWRALLDVLRDEGVMNVGLYSRSARSSLIRVRAGFEGQLSLATDADIRKFREAVIRRSNDDDREAMTWGEFFTTSACRDLIFHIREVNVTIPEIQAFLRSANLRFVGFILRDRRTAAEYAALFPDDPDGVNLDHWHEFETGRPETFLRSMYYFHVQKFPGTTRPGQYFQTCVGK